MASFVLFFFPLGVLGGIWDLIESVSEGFLTYSCTRMRKSVVNGLDGNKKFCFLFRA